MKPLRATMSRLIGKHALITGATSGIGLETAKQFVAEGATVAMTGRSLAKLRDVTREFPAGTLLYESDSRSIPDQRKLASNLLEAWEWLDVVFLNAGDVTHRPIHEWNEAIYDRVMDTNLKGPFFLIQALLPLLRNPSSVILCGSVSAHIGLPQSSVYAASKAGLLSLARTISGECLNRGIRVNGLSPGPTETPALRKLGLDSEAERLLRDEIEALVPLRRLGTPVELAKAAVFLASDESQFMVGTELLVDGGVRNL